MRRPSNWSTRRYYSTTLLGICAIISILALASQASADVIVYDKTKIYFGDPKKATSAKKPAVVRLKEVYKHIEAYKKIKAESLKPEDARYHILMAEATKKFRKILRKIAAEKGYDLISELNSISARVPLVDVTELAVKKVKNSP